MMKMKRSLIISLILIGLIGCGTTNNEQAENINEQSINERDENVDEQQTNEQEKEAPNDAMNPDQDFIVSQMERVPFTEFELEIEYNNDIEYEVDIDRKSNGHYKIKLEDDVNNVHLTNREAFEHLYPMISMLTITNDSETDDVIDDVLNVFDLTDDFSKFNLEIKFNDGIEREYKVKR